MSEQLDHDETVSPFHVVIGTQKRKSANVIVLTEARRHYDVENCHHWRLIIDPALNEVECEDCGARLNPVDVLGRRSTSSSTLTCSQTSRRGFQKGTVMSTATTSWTCYARPVWRYGQRCGHVNVTATQNCSQCGCAWQASEDRRQKEGKGGGKLPRSA